jgi:hypothetical protein
MSLNLEEAIGVYESMSEAAKAQLLGGLCFDLTIDFRIIAGEPMVTQSGLEKLQGINEIQHHALGQMLKYQQADPKRYSDRDFFLSVFRMAKNYGLAGQVQRSLMTGR